MKFEIKDDVIWVNPDREEEVPRWDTQKHINEARELIRDIEKLIISTETEV